MTRMSVCNMLCTRSGAPRPTSPSPDQAASSSTIQMMQAAQQQQLNCRARTPHRLCFATHSSFQPLPLRHATSLPRPRQCCPHTLSAAAAAATAKDHQQYASTSISSTNSSSSSSSHCWWSQLDWELLLLVSALPPVPTALAEEGLKYDSSRGEGIVKTLSGALYIGLLLYFLFRVLGRRARKAREERIAGQGPVRTIFTTWIEKATEGKERPKETAAAAFIGAIQAGLIGFGLFMFASRVEGMVYGSDLPSGYTARNIAVTVRTIIVGLMYLATFIFSANALGLTGLGIQLLLFPDSLPDDEPSPSSRLPKEPQLPKVTVTSSPQEIKAAFEAVARAQQGGGSSSSGGGSDGVGSSSSAARPMAGATSSSSSSSSSTDSSEVDVIG